MSYPITKIGRRQAVEGKRENIVGEDWEGLQDDLLAKIVENLSLRDCLYFSSVCMSWNNTVAESLPGEKKTVGFPWLVMPSQNPGGLRSCLSIVEDRVRNLRLPDASGKYSYVWCTSEDWLIMMVATGKPPPHSWYDFEVELMNPFSGDKVLLPKILGQRRKLVLSGSPSEQDCVYMLVPEQHTIQNNYVDFWILGARNWIMCFVGTVITFEDVVFSNGSFYILTLDYNVLIIDARSVYSEIKKGNNILTSTVVLDVLGIRTWRFDRLMNGFKFHFHHVRGSAIRRGISICATNYVVESCGEVLLVRRYFVDFRRSTTGFEVFRLDVADKTWTKVENLGDSVLFVGKFSKSYSAKKLGPASSTGSVYFANDPPSSWDYEWDSSRKPIDDFSSEWGVFKLNSSEYPSSEVLHVGRLTTVSCLWITAPLWWYCSKQDKKKGGCSFYLC